MLDFVKKNLVWISIGLCVLGVVLSIVGIPTQQPIFFFIGIVLALPTIAYIVYQVFFDKGKAELNLHTNAHRVNTGNVTTIVDKKENLILMHDEDDDLEPLYNGFASDQEIEHKLSEIVKEERQKSIDATPATVIPQIQPDPEVFDAAAVKTATQGELFRQREIQAEDLIKPEAFIAPAPIINTTPAPLIKEEDLEPASPIATELSSPNEPLTPTAAELPPHDEPVTQVPTQVLNDLDQSINNLILNNLKTEAEAAMRNELKKKKSQEKKALLAQENLEKYLRHYFIETAACFLLDRNIYKDSRGIAPYNKFAVNKISGLPEYSMSCTKGRLYKFCTYLLDVEKFIHTPELYESFITAIEKGIPLSRISETLHPIYRKKYKKDFVLPLANREDWDNVIILVFNNYILNNDNFKDVFTRVPFEIPIAYNEQNVTDYLCDPDVQARFAERFPSFTEIGIPTIWEAMYICFINSIKQKLSTAQLENAILKDYKKIARALKRTDNTRRKLLKKAS